MRTSDLLYWNKKRTHQVKSQRRRREGKGEDVTEIFLERMLGTITVRFFRNFKFAGD